MDEHDDCVVGEVFFALCKSIDTPVSLGAWLRFKHCQLELAEFEIDPGDYLDSASFEVDYLVSSFLSKYKGLTTGLDLEAEAVKRLISSEDQCRSTNVRIREGRRLGHAKFESRLHVARRKIASLLGPFSLFCIEPGFGWGPGATNDIRRSAAFVDTKICQTPISCTRTAAGLFTSVLRCDRHWSLAIANHHDKGDALLVFTESSVIDTVPKNAKTHRVIAKEPRANGFLQKGVGSYFRKRLKHVGVDLDDQSPNQRGASSAFRDGLATLDLKAASDTVSTELVYELLPVDWALALDDLRCKSSILPDGSTIRLEKFSSMGNGFTFELESLIFWSLGLAVQAESRETLSVDRRKTLLVYGDDIIIDSCDAPALVELLEYCGFTLNKAKSYISGAFYESCGKHYFQGDDVTPIYQKDLVVDVPSNIRLSNRLIRFGARAGRLSPLIRSAWLASVRASVYSSWIQIPFGTDGDDGWLTPASRFAPVPSDANFGLRCNVLRDVTLPLPGYDHALFAHTLRRNQGKNGTPGPAGLAFPSSFDPPFWGEVEKPAKVPCLGHRWVMPTGEFDLD